MNSVNIMGRLTRDPEVRYSQGENSMAIARYTLAVNRMGKKDEADFINIVAFGKAGEFAEKYFKQGQQIGVTGRLQSGSYNNKDGQKIFTTDVIADNQFFASSKSDVTTGNSKGNKNSEDKVKGEMNTPSSIDEEELPFSWWL